MGDVKNLLLLLGSAVFAAALLALGMVQYYNRDGVHKLDYVLLAPDTLSALHFESGSSEGGGVSERYVFDSLTLLAYNEETRTWDRREISIDQYVDFYEKIRGDISLKDRDDSLVSLFETGSGPRLLIQVRPASSRTGAFVRTFQEIQFSSDGDNYRIELRNSDSKRQWAYFHHPELWNQVKLEIL